MTTAVQLARVQFALTIGYHFMFVPISIGVGLIMVLAARRYRRTGVAADRSAVDLWTRAYDHTGQIIRGFFGIKPFADNTLFMTDTFVPPGVP